MRRIIVCGPPHSGKSVFLANLMRHLPPDSFYLTFAAPDGEWHWSNFGDQDLVSTVRQKGSFSTDFMESMLHAIRANQQDLVLVDTGGVMSSENKKIFRVCDGCIILSSNPEAKAQWRAFASENGVSVLAELDSVLHGRCELSPATPDGVVRGTISGLERGHTVQSETLEAVASRLRDIIRTNSAEMMSEGELLCNINGATVSQRLLEDEESRKDPFLGIRPAHLPAALRLTQSVARLQEVRIWNVRASILASAYATSLAGSVSLFDVSKGYIRIPDLTPKGNGNGNGAIEWEVIPLHELTLVKWRNRRFVTADDLPLLVPPEVDITKGVVLASQEPPMWVHATLARAYARAGVPFVGQFWPVESGRAQPTLGGRMWSEVHPHAGPAVVVAGPEQKIGEIFPVSFDFLRWGTPIVGRLSSGEVVVDAENSHVQTHPSVLPVLGEALAQVKSDDRSFMVTEVDLGRVVGKNIRVKTTDSDEILFAKRPGRLGLTRFVKNREPEPCSRVVLVLKCLSEGAYVLITAFIGTRCPAEPWDRNADEHSVPFWNSEALVWGTEEVIEGTETTACPW